MRTMLPGDPAVHRSFNRNARRCGQWPGQREFHQPYPTIATVPCGHTSDLWVGLFSIASSSTVTVPVGTTQRWSFHATGGGIGVAASDLQLVSTVATGNKIATTGSAAANVGALLALFP